MINRVTIYNFKCLHEVSARFSKVNVMTGVNGRGKSSLIQSLLVLSQSWKEKEYNKLLPNGSLTHLGNFSDIVNAYSLGKKVRFKFEAEGYKEKSFLLEYTKNEDKPTIGSLSLLKVDGNRIIANTDENEVSSASTENSDVDINERMGSVDDYPGLSQIKRVIYISANRKAANIEEELDETTTALKYDGSNVLNVIWSRGDEFKEKVESRLKAIFDGAMLNIERVNQKLVLSMNSVSNSRLYTPENVGFGFGYILSLVTASLIATERDILIIENPESHLHPSAQANIMNLLIEDSKKNGYQLIVETHSDHVVNSVLVGIKKGQCTKEDVEILFFSNITDEKGHSESRIQNLEVTQKGRILNPPKQFCDQYAKDLKVIYG